MHFVHSFDQRTEFIEPAKCTTFTKHMMLSSKSTVNKEATFLIWFHISLGCFGDITSL
jgi:hypothetical protein